MSVGSSLGMIEALNLSKLSNIKYKTVLPCSSILIWFPLRFLSSKALSACNSKCLSKFTIRSLNWNIALIARNSYMLPLHRLLIHIVNIATDSTYLLGHVVVAGSVHVFVRPVEEFTACNGTLLRSTGNVKFGLRI